MKHLFLILIGFLILSCNKKIEPEKVEIDKVETIDTIVTVNKAKYPLYDFDQVEHYKSNLTSEQEGNLRETDSIAFKILMKAFPKTIDDSMFYIKLNQNYSRKKIDSKLNSVISEIYSEKFSGQSPSKACDAFYRDILIFKKKEKIVGLSKICFDCELHYTIGNSRNDDLLGEKGDFKKIKNILFK